MKVVSREEWTQARTALLVREKAFSREREALAQARRDLPWEEVTKDYVFDGPDGKLTLPDLFGACGQLVVYHFMFPPEWDAGCPHCSFWADSFNGTLAHLRARDVSFAAVSRAPIGKITAYQFLDLVPKGRDEPAEGDPQFWVRRHDEYGSLSRHQGADPDSW